MARKISLFDQDENKLHTWTKAGIDICNSFTVIYPDNLFVNAIRLIDSIESIFLRDNKTVVYLQSGHYLIIIR